MKNIINNLSTSEKTDKENKEQEELMIDKNKEVKKERNKNNDFVRNVDYKTLIDLIDISESDEDKIYSANVLVENNTFDPNGNYINVCVEPFGEFDYDGIYRKISRVNTNFYNISLTDYYEHPLYTFLKKTQGYRNIYFQNTYKGIYRYIYENMYEDEIFKLNCLDYCFTPLISDLYKTYFTHEFRTKYYHIPLNMNFLSDARVYDYLKGNEIGYYIDKCKNLTHYKTKKEMTDNKYKIVSIPKDIAKLFNKLTAYFEEAIKYLKLDEKTGYYCYHHPDNVIIPVVCKHIVLLMKGVNPIDVANECYKDGICKYCKQDMIAYNQMETLTLPPSASSLVISFAECFKSGLSTETIIHIVMNYCIRRLDKLGVSIYSGDECVGFTAIFILRLIKITSQHFKLIDYKIKGLTQKISQKLALLGKSEEDVKNMLENNDIFGDIENVNIQLLSALEESKNKNKNNEFSVDAEDVLFNSPKNRTPINKIQELYLNNKYELYKTVLAVKILYNSLYNWKFDDKNLIDISDIFRDDIKLKINTIGFKFFQLTYKFYCPVNMIHHYDNNKCKYCGLLKNGDNSDDIYNKYNEIINNVSTAEPFTIKDNELNKINNDIKILDDINKVVPDRFKDILHKYGLDYTTIASFENNFKIINNNYFKHLAIILNISQDKLTEYTLKNKPEEYTKKIFVYICKNEFEKEETIVNILFSCYDKTDITALID